MRRLMVFEPRVSRDRFFLICLEVINLFFFTYRIIKASSLRVLFRVLPEPGMRLMTPNLKYTIRARLIIRSLDIFTILEISRNDIHSFLEKLIYLSINKAAVLFQWEFNGGSKLQKSIFHIDQ